MKSEDVGLTVRAISFQDFQAICGHDPPTSQTDRQTTCDRKTALCTIVHRAVKDPGPAPNQTLYDADDSVDFELLGDGHVGVVVRGTPRIGHTLAVGPHTQPDVGHRLGPDQSKVTQHGQQEQPQTSRLNVPPNHLPTDLFADTQTSLELYFD